MRSNLAPVSILGCVSAVAGYALAASAQAKLTKRSPAFVQAEKFTKCMRSHGIKNFPEPTIADGQIDYLGAPGVGREPGFVSASKTCARLLGLKYKTGTKSG